MQDEREAEAAALHAEKEETNLLAELAEVRAKLAKVESEEKELRSELLQATEKLQKHQEKPAQAMQAQPVGKDKPAVLPSDAKTKSDSCGGGTEIGASKSEIPVPISTGIPPASALGAINPPGMGILSGPSMGLGIPPASALGAINPPGMGILSGPSMGLGSGILGPIGGQGTSAGWGGVGLAGGASAWGSMGNGVAGGWGGVSSTTANGIRPFGILGPLDNHVPPLNLKPLGSSSMSSSEDNKPTELQGASALPSSPSKQDKDGKASGATSPSSPGPEVFSITSDGEVSDDSIEAPIPKGPIPMTIEEVVTDELTMEDIAKGFTRIVLERAKEAVTRKSVLSIRRLERQSTSRSVVFRERVSITEIAGRPEVKAKVPMAW
jgi:hypothetical protein